MLNKVILQVNVTRDVELRYTSSGAAIAKVGMAVNDAWKDKATGEKREEVCFIDGTVFGKSAEIINQYVSKGSKLLIVGKLKLEQWQDQNGQKRQKHSIAIEDFNFLDSKQSGGQDRHNQQKSNGYQPQEDEYQDSIPF